MKDRSNIDRLPPDGRGSIRAPRVGSAVLRICFLRFCVSLCVVFWLPGCLLYHHLHDGNPLTIEMPTGQIQELPAPGQPLPTVRGPNEREKLMATLKEELKDATPEERDQWMRDVQQLHPAQAKIALRLRREMLDRKAAAEAAAKAKKSDTAAAIAVPTAQFDRLPGELFGQTSNIVPDSLSTFGHSQFRTTAMNTIPGMESSNTNRTASRIPDQISDGSTVNLVDGVQTAPPVLPLPDPVREAFPQNNPFEPNGATAPPPVNNALPLQPVPTESARSGLRDRFSNWGARLGFGREEGGDARAPVNEPTTVPQFEPKARQIPVNQAPIHNLQSLILRRETELRNIGSVAPQQEKQRQEYILRHVELRLLYIMSNQQSRALAAIPGITSAEQEFWQQVLWGLSDYFDIKGEPNRTKRLTRTVKQFETAVDRLKQEATLAIRNVNFCRKISSFGNYERFRRDDFTAGQPVLVYAEVDNFKSVPVEDGYYRTILKSRIEIFKGDGRGTPIDSVTFKPTEDLCRNPRRDYFHSYEMTIPQDIGLGPHTLVLTIEDSSTGKQASESVSFFVK